VWVAQVALSVWMTLGGSAFYGISGLAVTGVALVAFRWLTRSWAQAFFWSALVGFVFVLGLIAATLSVY
jgi:endonuclease/exonuclease/phosphatase (EEP) superfamily protein YafD